MRLADKPASGTELSAWYLARMREEKIVDTRRDAQEIFYRVADPRVRDILATLKNAFC